MAEQYEVIVYGGTSGGIGAAVAAARRGRRTLLLEPTGRIGGLMTGGLGRTDILSLSAAGGIFREFADRVLAYYTGRYGADSAQVEQCNGGLYFEPSVALQLLLELVQAEPCLQLIYGETLTAAFRTGTGLTELEVRGAQANAVRRLRAEVFIDGTYEGDLAAAAGVPYSVGRESRDDWNEEYAGKIYMNYDEERKEVFPGSTGEGDNRVQAYNFRLCLTDVDANRVAVMRPLAYDREDYASLPGDVRAGRVGSIRDALNILPIPNGKTDANNHHYCSCSSDLPEENTYYPEASPAARAAIADRHRQYVQGLLWFLQHDEELPAAFRQEAQRWGYAADEFTETSFFPPQLYVREARRIHGEYTFTENDARLAPGLGRSPTHYDSIAVGAYPIDSHATRKREPAGRNKALEGFLGLLYISEIYQIPYGVIVPREVDGLLVPVAVSATHMGFGTIRMEPCWMQLGYAAGIAADLALTQRLAVREVQIDSLQDELLRAGQLIAYFRNAAALSGVIGRACQYFGAKGFFVSYELQPDAPVSVAEASRLISLSRMLAGGSRLPMLPAAPRLLPAGVEMAPRFPLEEPKPGDYWRDHPLLTGLRLRKWLRTAAGSLGVNAPEVGPDDAETVPLGQFLACLYTLLQTNRTLTR